MHFYHSSALKETWLTFPGRFLPLMPRTVNLVFSSWSAAPESTPPWSTAHRSVQEKQTFRTAIAASPQRGYIGGQASRSPVAFHRAARFRGARASECIATALLCVKGAVNLCTDAGDYGKGFFFQQQQVWKSNIYKDRLISCKENIWSLEGGNKHEVWLIPAPCLRGKKK